MKLICVRFLADDFATMLLFWRDVVKLPAKYVLEEAEYAYFDVEGAGVELVGRSGYADDCGDPALAERATGYRALLDFKVDDVDASYGELVAAGVRPITAPTSRPQWGVRAALLADPENNLLEIYTPLPEEEGADQA